MIASVSATDVTIDQDGAATLTIGGELLGGAVIDFSVDGSDVTAASKVQVKLKADLISEPTANIVSGETIERGTKIELYCETEGAVIYYTTDGSCPCDETTRKRYDDPITINENIVIKAMAVTTDMIESDVVEFVYSVYDDEDAIGEISINGIVQIYPLPVRDQLNVTANGEIIQNVTVSAMNGITVASSTKPSTIITLDVSTIPTGIYIINIVTENGIYSRKILKVE